MGVGKSGKTICFYYCSNKHYTMTKTSLHKYFDVLATYIRKISRFRHFSAQDKVSAFLNVVVQATPIHGIVVQF